jgi:hypothetical protein
MSICFRAGGVALGVLLDHALQRGAHEGHTGGLQRLQIDRRQEMRQRGVQRVRMAVRQDIVDGSGRLAFMAPQRRDRIVHVQQLGDCRRQMRHVAHLAAADRHHAWPRDVAGPPDATDQGRLLGIGG